MFKSIINKLIRCTNYASCIIYYLIICFEINVKN